MTKLNVIADDYIKGAKKSAGGAEKEKTNSFKTVTTFKTLFLKLTQMLTKVLKYVGFKNEFACLLFYPRVSVSSVRVRVCGCPLCLNPYGSLLRCCCCCTYGRFLRNIELKTNVETFFSLKGFPSFREKRKCFG